MLDMSLKGLATLIASVKLQRSCLVWVLPDIWKCSKADQIMGANGYSSWRSPGAIRLPIWLKYCHNMAPKLIWHEYLVAPMIWCNFEHFRVSGSISTGQLLCSFTEAIRVASPFDQNSQKFWLFFVLRFFILRFFILRSYIEYVDSVSTVATEM